MVEINEPYVKQYDNNGVLLNPIKESYTHQAANRRHRRAFDRPPRFMSNKKGVCLSITRAKGEPHRKFYKKMQRIGNKTILHYSDTK